MAHSCTVACTAGWKAGRKCHCRACGANFLGVGPFDKHRQRDRCVDPATIGMSLNEYGFWTTDDTKDKKDD